VRVLQQEPVTLKPYDFQKEAILQLLKQNHPETGDRSALIGDDMGLGKTIEAILLDLSRRNKHNAYYTAKTLVVTQTSVMGSWRDHYAAWAPQLRVTVIDRKNRKAFLEALKAPTDSKSGHQVFICHWQVLRFISDELKDVQWFSIIGDEIHNIKNRKAQQSQVFKKLSTQYKLGLSGTWADNRPDDAWSVLNWLWPKTFSSYWSFFNYHVINKKHNMGTCEAEGCDGYHKRAYTELAGVHAPEEIHAKMGMSYIRRTKEQVWKDIPEKTYEDREVELTDRQRRTYDMMAEEMLAWVGKHEDQPIPAPSVISQLTRLQQFAVAYGRLETKIVNKRDPETGAKWQEEKQILILDEPSSKLDAAMDIIGATNERIVVFGQSKQAINLLAARLSKASISYGILTGDTKQADRDLAVQKFQAGELRVFLSTIKAGGVGITLTAATICLFLDRAWSPSANRQAEDRLHRLGQKNAVLIITLVAERTIDRKRNDKIAMKWEWLREVLEPKG
jgi:SNF2 family DNA or RNA helicase